MLPPSIFDDKPCLIEFSTSGCSSMLGTMMSSDAGLEFLHHPQLVAAEAHDFDVQIVVDEFHFLAQRHEGIAAVEQAAQDVGQLDDQFARRIGIEAHQRRNRVQRIEQEVRIDLVLQRLHAGVQQQAFLLFQLDLDAHAVPDLQFGSDHRDRRGVDQQLPPTRFGLSRLKVRLGAKRESSVCTKRSATMVTKNMVCHSNGRGVGRLRRIQR